MSSASTPPDNNPRKRRRLNNNLATSDRMQVMVGIEKRKVEKLKQELAEALIAKDNALKDLGQIKSDTIAQIQSKQNEMDKIQTKLQIVFHENEESKQREKTLIHKIEIIESQIETLQKDNFNLRAKIYNKKKTNLNTNNNNNNMLPNGHKPNENNNNNKNYEIECVKLKKEIEIKKVTINSQNEEIIRLEAQINEINVNNTQITQSLNKASKHIDRLQKQLNDKTENQSNLAKSEMFNITDSFERKIRLLESELSDHKKETLKLKIISEEYELNKNKYSELKNKYMQLMELNTKYEPIYNELNEWKNIIREMCFNLFGKNDKYLFENNEFELKICLKELNEKYIILIKEKNECKSNLVLVKNKLNEMNKELNELKLSNKKEIKLKQESLNKIKTITKQLNEYKNECQSYKNIFQTYNAMSPNKTNEQKQINKLFHENNKLGEKINELNNEILKSNKLNENIEIENVKLQQRVNNGEFNTLNTNVLNIKNNPLKIAMDKKKNEQKEKIIFYKEKIKDLENKLNKINKNVCENNNTKNNNCNEIKYYEIENKYNILIKKNKLKVEEIGNIKKELESSKKIHQRMKTLFGKKAGEYRERIYQMTGYNICLLGNGKDYRLQHLWMDNQNDEIILQIDKCGQLQLKDTNFMRNKMDKSLLNKLQKTRSLPIFLSELTLWLYNDNH